MEAADLLERRRNFLRALLIRFTALGVGCLLALIVFEGLLRVLGLAPSQGVGTVMQADFERIPGLFAPGQQLIDRQNPKLPFRVSINALGYRGSEIDRQPKATELRLLAVGDSFTFGDFVDDEETLPAQLEHVLRRRCRDARVINAGVGGSTLLTHHEMIRRALPLEPDAVLLTFSENDVADLASPIWLSLAQNRAQKSRFPLAYLYPLLRHTAIWNYALKVRATWAAERRPDARRSTEEGSEESGMKDATRSWRDEYLRRLAGIRDLLDEAGVPLIFVVYPSHYSVEFPDRAEQVIWVEREARRLGIRVVPLIDVLRASGLAMNTLYLLPEDGHPSGRGYEIAVGELVQKVDWAAISPERCVP